MGYPPISDIHYIHRFNHNSNKKDELNNLVRRPDTYPEFCVAYRIYDDARIRFAVSICSIKDSYARSIGRAHAEERLEDDKYIELTLDEFKNYIKNEMKPFNNIVETFPVKFDVINHFSDFHRRFLNYVLKYYIVQKNYAGVNLLNPKN